MYRLSTRYMHGLLSADRTPIGLERRNFHLVKCHAEPQSPSHIELTGDDLQVINRSAGAK